MQWIRDAHTWCSIQSTYFSMSSFKGKANGSQSWRCLSSEGGLLLESKSKGEIKDDLTKYRKDDSDIYNGLTSSINATDASCLKNTCFDEAGKFEACLKIECLAEGWEFDALFRSRRDFEAIEVGWCFRIGLKCEAWFEYHRIADIFRQKSSWDYLSIKYCV